MARAPAKTTTATATDARQASELMAAAGRGYVDWGAAAAGTAVALAISAVLFTFGSAVGLASDAPRESGFGIAMAGWAAAIWLLWIPLVSAMAGGYLAGLMRAPWPGSSETEIEMRDGAHGLIVWATSTVLVSAGLGLLSVLAALGAQQAGAAGEQAAQAAELARNSGVLFGFASAAGSVLGAGLAWWCATVGGAHRDEPADLYGFVPDFLRR